VASIQEKLAWLEAITRRIEQFVHDGGDLKSVEAAPLGMALFHALQDLGNEFGIHSPDSSRRHSSASRNGTNMKPVEDV
jgi:hypothetical protein